MSRRWLLPHGVEDVLPPQAGVLYRHSRDLLELCGLHGYQPILPALFEFTESLLLDSENELDLRTGKLIDQHSGRMLGVRADFSAQAARIYARNFYPDAPVRLCYFGELLHARGGSNNRIPLRIGAELFGSSGMDASIEVARLLSECLSASGVDESFWVVGHGGLFQHLARDLPPDVRGEIQAALQRKDLDEMRKLGAPEELILLGTLYGAAADFDRAVSALEGDPVCTRSVAEVRALIDGLGQPAGNVSFDLGEVHGCTYHTGVVFAAFAPGYGSVIARGGRYDELASRFGHSVSATGFDLDLRALLTELPADASNARAQAVYAPAEVDDETIDRLRQSGRPVVRALEGDQGARACGCGAELRLNEAGAWQVAELAEERSGQ
ncbi:MAG: ATP phosphoribosyltransferase regulatory subunit [Gammaproteobacteria bacterium AqS3]|nr:ATP phosphoribosyltransferase regulatory subunit [Gammaproteobacteria bacterium AqS3]